jgi:hypothetical protein
MEQNVNPKLAEPVPADPQRAVTEALASRMPEMQTVGKAGLAEMLAEIKAKKAGPAFKEHVVDGVLVRSYADGRTEVAGDYRNRDVWEPAPDLVVDGKTIKVQRNKVTGEQKALATGQIINVNNTPENKALTAALEGTIKSVLPGGKSYDSASSSAGNLRSTVEALSAIRAGADQGALADFGLQLRKLGERLNIPSAATAPTDQLSSLLKERVFHKLGGLGVAISDADRQFMKEAAGDISKDPRAMKRLLALDAAASIKELSRHNSRVEQLSAREGMEFLKDNRIPLHYDFGKDDEFADMVENALKGRPTIEGLGAPASKVKGKEEVRSGYGEPVKIKGF